MASRKYFRILPSVNAASLRDQTIRFQSTRVHGGRGAAGFDGGSLMRKFVTAFLNDESGAAAAEYALILAVVCTGIAVAVLALGNEISAAITAATTAITTG
jgi:pilus assembly protein Flp/PilA